MSAVFGVFGVHHFYLGRPLLGLVDVGLSVGWLYAFFTGQFGLGLLLFGVDFGHGLFETIRLLIGAYRDGDGGIVAYPGQFKHSASP